MGGSGGIISVRLEKENPIRMSVHLTPHLHHFPPLFELISHTCLSKENQYALAKFKTKAAH